LDAGKANFGITIVTLISYVFGIRYVPRLMLSNSFPKWDGVETLRRLKLEHGGHALSSNRLK
jgi:hypothetical protein